MDTLPKEHRALVNYIRSHDAIPLGEGVIAEKRVDIFRGSAITSLLLSEETRKKFPSLKLEEKRDAHEILQLLLDKGLFLQVRQSNGRLYQPSMTRRWGDDADYAWIYSGPMFYNLLIGIAIVIAILLLFMYPLWPHSLKVVGWYATMALGAFVGFIIVLAIVRLIVFVITYFTVKPGVWLFPNLFADVGFIESFIPLYSWNQ